jgi:hypothetical protein
VSVRPVVAIRFWEARVAPGRLDDAVAWVEAWLRARAALIDGHAGSEVFVADGDEQLAQPPRIVLLTRWSVGAEALDALAELEAVLPPDGSIDRAHGWFFRPA